MKYNVSVKKSDLADGKPKLAEVNGKKIMLVMIQGKAYAIDNVCSHRGGPLNEGKMADFEVTCPWHGAKYDVRTGKVDPTTTWGKFQQPYSVNIDEATGKISVEM